VTRLAVAAGLNPRAVADFDEDEFRSLDAAVRARERHASWTNVNEILATCVEALSAIHARLEAGIATVSVQHTKEIEEPEPYPRPEWVGAPKAKEIVVEHVADMLSHMKGATVNGTKVG
jgi:hypothetical protein